MKKLFAASLVVVMILMAGAALASSPTVHTTIRQVKFFFDGVEKAPLAHQGAIIHQGTTYVPIRFIAENLGKEVIWDEAKQAVIITEKSASAPAPKAPVVSYEDGTYRGIFADGGEFQVSIQFKLTNNIVSAVSFRQLGYKGVDYRTSTDPKIVALRKQHEDLAKYLEGKDIRESLKDLYKPGEIVSPVTVGVDVLSGATLRAGKIISAVRDALNRGVYSY